MAKYIDGDKLKAEIRKMVNAHIQEHDDMIGVECHLLADEANLKACELIHVIELIDSFQHEQLPGIEEHGVPGKDFIPVEWVDACEKYGKWKIVQQEQPKMIIPSAGSGAMGTTPPKFKLDVKQDLPVGLEKEIQEYLEKLCGGHGGFVDDLTDDDLTGFALHFYRLGINARKK